MVSIIMILVALLGSLGGVRGSGAALADAGPSAVAAAGGSINRASRVNTHHATFDNQGAARKSVALSSLSLPKVGTKGVAETAETAETAGALPSL